MKPFLNEIEYSPLEAFQKLSHLRYVTFLDSARFHPEHGRYSILAADPCQVISAKKDWVTISGKQLKQTIRGNPWEVLDSNLSRFRLAGLNENPDLPVGAAVGFLGYDAGSWLDRVPASKDPLIPSPDLWFGFYDVLLVFDHLEKRGWLVSSGMDESGILSNAQAAFRRDQFLDELQADVACFSWDTNREESIAPILSADEYESAVRKALHYIKRGDIYQVNLSQPFMGRIAEAPQDTYLRLRQANPAPFGAYLDFEEGQILSSSPERFLRMDRRRIQTRPIKGTCPRVGDPALDWKKAEELLASEKNRAELLMITDLLRNDLGRVSEFGSVKVSELMRCEEYETVYHLVSTVEANLRNHVLHLDALASCFPGGSITGAPKLRSMEIIHELETVGRGIYTGSLGYIGFNGISDFNIMIRTILHREGEVCFHAGGGIVADSNPRLEYEETLHKAKGLLRLWTSTELRKTNRILAQG